MDTLTLSPKTDKKSVQFNNTLSISKGTKLGKRFKLEGIIISIIHLTVEENVD